MRKRLFRAVLPGLLIVVVLAAGCVPVPAQTGGATSTTSVSTAEPSATTAITPTTTVSATVSVTPTTSFTATVPVTPTTSFTATVPVTPTLAVTATMAVTPTGVISGTAVTTATTPLGPTPDMSTSLPAGAAGPTPSGTGTPSGDFRVTLEDNGKTITLRPGDRFLLYLGDQYQWDLNISDQDVISRVMGVMVIQGAQGLFDARQAGTSTITATGNPPCLTATPPCKMPSQAFQVQIVVSPTQ